MVDRSPGTLGDVTRQLWDQLSQRLVVLIGQDGFTALFDRSLHLASASFPWLASSDASTDKLSRLEALNGALHIRGPDDSKHAVVLLLSTFVDLLCTLIGQNLTMNILRTAWGDAFEEAVQEVSQWSTK